LFATKFPKFCCSSEFVAEAAAVKSPKALSKRLSSGFFHFFEDGGVGVERLGGGSDELVEGVFTSISVTGIL